MSEALVTLPDGRKAKITFDSPEQLDATIADLAKGGQQASSDQRAQSWGPPSAWQQFKRDTPYAGGIADALQNEARGVVNPLIGLGQGVAHNPAVLSGSPLAPIAQAVTAALGGSQGVDRLVEQREQDIAKDRALSGSRGGESWELAGTAMSPMNFMGGGAGGNALARIGAAARTGGMVAATQPVAGGDNFAIEKAKQVGLGSLAGGVLGAAAEPVAAALARGGDALKPSERGRAQGARDLRAG
jgi:hypothetical protein